MMKPETTEKLVRRLAQGNPETLALGAAVAGILELVPSVPDDVLNKVVVTPGRDGADFSTNAALVVQAWLSKEVGNAQ
jgi:hypothetical protein